MDYGTSFTDDEIRDLSNRIEAVYFQARQDIQRDLRDFIHKFKAKEAIHSEQVARGEWTKEQYENWIRGQVFQGKRWIEKRDQMTELMRHSNEIAIRMINGYRTNTFIENSNYEAYSLEHKLGANIGFTLFNEDSVNNLIMNDPKILPKWKIDEEKDYIWNRKAVNNIITQGIVQGKKLTDIADMLSEGLSSRNKRKMLTFARTGMTQAQNAGRLARLYEARNQGIPVVKEWMATLDERTRTTHRHLDGRRVPIDKPFKIDGYEIKYPGDPEAPASLVFNCRCTLIEDFDATVLPEYQRYDNINGRPISAMTYDEWHKAREVTTIESSQVSIGGAKTVQEVNNFMNSQGWFAKQFNPLTGGYTDTNTVADLTGCDLDSAKAIASAYDQIFKRYPKLKGKFDAPDAHPYGMKGNTYAWSMSMYGKVEVNPKIFNDWSHVQSNYNKDVQHGWHPEGTTAESIIVHELGHNIDYLLAKEGILGGYTKSGELRTASSSMRNTIMKEVAKNDPIIAQTLKIWGTKEGTTNIIREHVSEYATKNTKEWFAECFAEYITSANPRLISKTFGEKLEELIGRLK